VQELPNPVQVDSGEEISVAVVVALIAGRIRLLDPVSDQALVRWSVQWSHGSIDRRPWLEAQSNEDGELELMLPQGEIELRLRPDAGEQCLAVFLLWTLDGPVPSEVFLAGPQ